MTLNGVVAVILRYFAEFDRFRRRKKSSRSLSYLLRFVCSSDAQTTCNFVHIFGRPFGTLWPHGWMDQDETSKEVGLGRAATLC